MFFFSFLFEFELSSVTLKGFSMVCNEQISQCNRIEEADLIRKNNGCLSGLLTPLL